MIKNLTYYNLMVVVHKIEKKGYTQEEALPIARRIFAEYSPFGLSINALVDRVLTKEEWEEENRKYGM